LRLNYKLQITKLQIPMRLYYTDCFLLDFDAAITDLLEVGGRTAVVLDRSAFYPASGGQVFDTGWLTIESGARFRVEEVAEDAQGEVLHIVGTVEGAANTFTGSEQAVRGGATSSAEPVVVLRPGVRVHGSVDAVRRRDHMQQHSGQHVISAAFVRLFQMPTVSFHMGEYTDSSSPAPKSCTIDLDAKSLTEAQVREAELLANAVVMEDRPVEVRFATMELARAMGVRKIPPEVRDELRLIDINDFDLNACGGTHVRSTGQIGPILLRKTEKVRQGVRVEFLCGERALRTARQDYTTLTDAAAAYSTHIWELPQQVRKSLDEIKAGQREKKKLLEELAELHAARLLAEASQQDVTAPTAPHEPPGTRFIAREFPERDAAFIKLLAQKVTAASTTPVAALLSAGGGAQPALVFAQTPGGPYDMGALMQQAMTRLGGRGGGNKDLAQGGAPAGADLSAVIEELLKLLQR
jgi:alanyl-tRNA synthetase